MSHNRKLSRERAKLYHRKKGPDGKHYLCGWCGIEVNVPGRKTFCSDACVREWRIRSDPGYASEEVFKRDCGICAICSIDTVKRQQDARIELKEAYERANVEPSRLPHATAKYADPVYRQVSAIWKAAGWPDHLGRRWWETDHTIPVVEGGGEASLDGLRTLCRPCHLRVTKELRQRLKKDKKKHENL